MDGDDLFNKYDSLKRHPEMLLRTHVKDAIECEFLTMAVGNYK